MAGRAEDAAARLRVAQPQQAPRTELVADASRRVRATVDLSQGRHRGLTQWCTDAAVELGRVRVKRQDVLSALVGQLLTDEVLARKIRAALREMPDG